MTSWETIHNSSSQFSQIKLDTPESYSSQNRDIFQGVSKSSIPTQSHSQLNKGANQSVKKSKMRSLITKSIVLFIIVISSALIAWRCSQTQGYCLPTTHIDLHYIKYKADEYSSGVLSPAISNINKGYEWIGKTNLKTAYNTVVYDGSSLRIVRVTNWLYYGYIQPFLEVMHQKISSKFSFWKNELIDYVNNPQYDITHDDSNNGDDDKDDLSLSSRMVEDNIKRTAKRILDYMDQINQDSVRSGMKREDARRKAHDIIREITHSNTIKDETEYQGNLEEESVESSEQEISKVACEIQAILQVSQLQQVELKEHLISIQAYLSPMLLNIQDPELLASALKSEIDQMRQDAEDQVRARTNQALSRVRPLLTDAVMSRVKSDIHSAQRAGLKELRQVYPLIYQVNEAIDNLFNQGGSV